LHEYDDFSETGTAPEMKKAAGFAGGHGDSIITISGANRDCTRAGRGDPAYAAARDDRRLITNGFYFEPRAHRALNEAGLEHLQIKY